MRALPTELVCVVGGVCRRKILRTCLNNSVFKFYSVIYCLPMYFADFFSSVFAINIFKVSGLQHFFFFIYNTYVMYTYVAVGLAIKGVQN